jgi:hypothetical protein
VDATHSAPPASDAARAELLGLMEDVTRADARLYQATDDTGRSMDTAKIVQDAQGDYLAVYHTRLADARFHTAIASSADLMHWRFLHDFGPGSSQPTIARLTDGGYVLAWEQDPRNHIAVRYYPTRAALLAGAAHRGFDARRTLSRCAEGTPNIYSVRLGPDIDHSVIDLGGHYWWKCDRDRQFRALLVDFDSWHPAAQPRYDDAVLRWGVGGNVGGRDAVAFRGHRFEVIEGQHAKSDFGSWRVFVYDCLTGRAEPAAIRTDGGSTAFANPKVTALTLPDGRDALAVSLFLPREGAAPGESGPLIYYTAY